MKEILDERIDRIDKCVLRGRRPRNIGHNARLPRHGPLISDPVVRLHTAGGGMGLGWSSVDEATARQLLGARLGDLFQLPEGSLARGEPIDLPLWDLVARLLDMPLYRLLGARGSRTVEVYDASIYIDDLELDDDAARALFSEEVASGREYGYRDFKIKVGRGARWMAPEAGLARDALVVQTVREAAGPEARIMLDANMGNTLNSAQDLMTRVWDADIHWFEEPFAEDPALNRAFKEFLLERELETLVADGEFAPPPYFFELVEDGWIDVAQQDFRGRGLTWWRAAAARLEQGPGRCAPHSWGSYVERFTHAHFAASTPNYELLEAAPAYMPGVVEDAWDLRHGKYEVPDEPGCGFDVEERVFEDGVKDRDGFRLVYAEV